MISIESLSKSFGKNKVLHQVNLSFEKGNVYGIVGENGAGKTTLFRCLTGLEKFEGEVKSESGSLKDRTGLLWTNPFFFSKMTGKEYIQLLANARKVELNDVDELNVFNLPLDDYAETYSTGMKKKLALTGVLAQENDVFILDEPFNGVDIQSNMIITEIIKRLKELNKTILISSHIFSTLSEICDEIHLLRKGEIIRSVQPEGFANLEKEMKDFTVGEKVNQLNLK